MATRISKTVAAEVAKAMAADTIGKKREELRKELKTLANDLREKHHPINQKVAEAYLAVPDYFKTTTYVYFMADGLTWIQVGGLAAFPVNKSQVVIEIPRECYELVFKLDKEMDALHKQLQTFMARVEATLYALKTVKRVETDFPEALAYLSDEIKAENCTTVALPISEIRNTINQYLGK